MTEAATAAACWLASTAAAEKPTNTTINAPCIDPKSSGSPTLSPKPIPSEHPKTAQTVCRSGPI